MAKKIGEISEVVAKDQYPAPETGNADECAGQHRKERGADGDLGVSHLLVLQPGAVQL